jgi:hypothetical protein
MSQNGKGDKPRPLTISREELGKRLEAIFGKKVKKPNPTKKKATK